MMKKNLRFILLAAFACCLTTAFADAVDKNYEKDNTFYGTTPYIELANMPDLGACMPAHPAFDSPEFANDIVRYCWGKQQREDAARVEEAIADAEWDDLEKVYANWKEAFGLTVSKEATPKIYALLNKTLRTTDPARRAVKAKYSRQRPFERFNDTMPSHEEDELRGEGSYPSGHTLRGWTITLILAQIAPTRAAEIYKRGMDYGYSRVIVGAHWQSDVDNSRMAASLLFSVLQTNADFQNDMKLAQQEYQEKTATRVRPLSAANKSTNAQVYAIDGRPVDGQTHGIIISDGQKYIQ